MSVAQVTALSQIRGGLRGHAVGLVAAWIPGSRKCLGIVLGSAPPGHWEEAEGAEGRGRRSVGCSVVSRKAPVDPQGAVRRGWLFRVVLSWGKGLDTPCGLVIGGGLPGTRWHLQPRKLPKSAEGCWP